MLGFEMGKKRDMITKKGKVSVQFLIGAIILIVGFGVLLYFIFLANPRPIIDRETCQQSIVFRGIAPDIPGVGLKEAVPLKCKTEKICLTMSGKDCKDISGTKDNPVNKIKLSKNKDKAKNKIMNVMADNMVDCHSMLGEGQLKFFPSGWLTNQKTIYGLICSRIVFDDEVKEKVDDIGYPEFYSLLGRKAIKDRSYLEYLHPGWKQSADSVSIFRLFQQEGTGDVDKIRDIDVRDWKMDLSRENGFAVIAMEAPVGQGGSLLKGSATAAGVITASILAVYFLPIGIIAGGTLLLVGGTTGATTGGFVLWHNYDEDYDYAAPAIMPYDINALKALGVNTFEIAP